MSGTIRRRVTPEMEGSAEVDSAVQVSASSCELTELMPSLSGSLFSSDSDGGILGSGESVALSSETKARTVALTLSRRLMQSLISSGLIAGTTPTSMRRKSGQGCLEGVFSRLDGDTCALADTVPAPKADC